MTQVVHILGHSANSLLRLAGLSLLSVLIHGGLSASTVEAGCPPVTLAPITQFATAGGRGVAAAHLNDDANIDLVILGSQGHDVGVYLGNGLGGFQYEGGYETGLFARALSLGDLNSDGFQDIVVANEGASNVGVLLGAREGSFGLVTLVPSGAGPRGVVTVDMNADGHLDIVTGNFLGNSVSVILGTGDGQFAAPVNYGPVASPLSVRAAHINTDAFVDIVVVSYDGNGVVAMLGLGDGYLAAPQLYPTGQRPFDVACADVNGDQIVDLAVAAYTTSQISLLLGNGDGTYQPSQSFSTNNQPRAIAIHDLNNDGLMDLLAGGTSLHIRFGSASGNFLNELTIPGDVGYQIVGTHINGDDKIDLVAAQGTLFLNAGTFGGVASHPENQNVMAGTLAQFDVTISGNSAEYQWRKNGIPIVDSPTVMGSTTSSLVLLDVQQSDVGAYDVLATGPCGATDTSFPAALSVIPSPHCKGDMNDDGTVDADDIQAFVEAVLAGASCE